MDPVSTLPVLFGLAWLLPLASFALIVLFGPRMGKAGIKAAYVATGAILASFVLSVFALFFVWLPNYDLPAEEQSATTASSHGNEHGAGQEHRDAHQPVHEKPVITGDWYTLGKFGALRITIGYYIDSLTVLMFFMVTFIATCIHFYSYGYMHEELDEVTDHEVTVHGHHLHRRGRFHRFFQYLSLFCFSMLGVVIAGNMAMVFVFWELVGICSYFLIGFYIERKSATTAANKAFIVNRIGDFGMIVGMMIIFATLGTFAFGDIDADGDGMPEPGIFSQVRSAENHHALVVPDRMVRAAAADEIAQGVEPTHAQIEVWRKDMEPGGIGHYAYWLLIVAGLGIFCGCVGKSAQFPLHVWLPDAMEGPTPVSALVHSATMVAAGVYLVGRFFPFFTPEVLLVIAIIGCITLFIAGTIAITAVDIKRVLAYSTVSQLGYMMLALGVGGWSAGMFHLITHAFFKSLLFMCSGSVIHAVHTNDLTKMGGLRNKMPWTAYTMLVGCLAIMGAGVPFAIGLSGHYSKDAILAQALSFKAANPMFGFLFYVAAGGASITAFYMFRMWFMTFAGEPRDQSRYDHAHESPRVMYYPLVILAVMAVGVGWSVFGFGVQPLLEQARPAGLLAEAHGVLMPVLVHPNEHASHLEEYHVAATWVATGTGLAGLLLAVAFYGLSILDPKEVKNQFKPIYAFLMHKWYFDELYHAAFVQPTLFVSRRVAEFDRKVIDGVIDNLAIGTLMISKLDDMFDRYIVDGFVDVFADWTYGIALWIRGAETGKVRQYVMFIVVGTVALFVLISFYLNSSLAAH
ncbi:MAG: NADH-quinone oxidoreductase subunit L [Pirellulales bacterium]